MSHPTDEDQSAGVQVRRKNGGRSRFIYCAPATLVEGSKNVREPLDQEDSSVRSMESIKRLLCILGETFREEC
jgi:hypothetical protein